MTLPATAPPPCPAALATLAAARPIGVFDSGIGGLSVLRALRAELPHEHFIYVADSAHAPYGQRGDAFVAARSLAIGSALLAGDGIKALVIACNTATAAAAQALRTAHPHLPIVGVEPALKPAAALTRTGRVGVLATQGTLQSQRYRQLQAAQPAHVQFIALACNGLADAIESEASRLAPASASASHLIEQYLRQLGPLGTQPGAIDTLVLGCTHYPLAEAAWRQHAGPRVALLEPGPPVARQARRLLAGHGLLQAPNAGPGRLQLRATGDASALHAAARQLGLVAT